MYAQVVRTLVTQVFSLPDSLPLSLSYLSLLLTDVMCVMQVFGFRVFMQVMLWCEGHLQGRSYSCVYKEKNPQTSHKIS